MVKYTKKKKDNEVSAGLAITFWVIAPVTILPVSSYFGFIMLPVSIALIITGGIVFFLVNKKISNKMYCEKNVRYFRILSCLSWLLAIGTMLLMSSSYFKSIEGVLAPAVFILITYAITFLVICKKLKNIVKNTF